MDLNFTPEEQAFRQETRSWVRDNLPQDISHKVHNALRLSKDDLQRWAKILGKKGWHGFGWPKEFGGPGWNAVQRHLFEEECALAGAPRILPFGPVMVAPVIMAFGTPEQHKRFLPGIMSGDDWWSQGYSEPGSGSDLASLKTRAELKGDKYIVNGQKTWTTLGQHGDWIFCLVRTDSSGKPQTGISFLLIDMKSPGITVRPIITLDGEHEVNEVWFDNVEVPVENRIGEENQGWTYAKYLLAHERTNIADVNRSKRELERLKRIAKAEKSAGRSLIEDIRFRDQVAQLEVDIVALEMMVLRVLSAEQGGKKALDIAGLLKIRGSEIQQRLTEADDAGLRRLFAAFHPRGDGSRLAGRLRRGDALRTAVLDLLQHAQDDDLRRLERGSAQHRRPDDPGGVTMDFDFNTDQEQLRDAVRKWVEKGYDFERRQAIVKEGGFSREAWSEMTDLGLMGLAVPEAHGGMGFGPVEAMVVSEELGRGIVLEPYAAVALVATNLLAQHAPAAVQQDWLPRIASGEALVVLAHQERDARHVLSYVSTTARQQGDKWVLDGAKGVVPVGDKADAFIVPARVSGGADDTQGIGLFLVERTSGTSTNGYPMQDGSRAAELKLAQAPATLLVGPDKGYEALEAAIDIGIAAQCAEAVGAMDKLFAVTVEYLNTRKQFGVAIGTFQALRHRVADMKMQLELARSMSYFATLKLGDATDSRRRALSQAKVQLGQAMRLVGQQAIQLHGGIGVTDEYIAGHYFKRLTCLEMTFGDTLHHLGEVSARMQDSAGVFA